MSQDARTGDDKLLAHFAPFFRRAAEEGLDLAACDLVLTLLRPIIPFELGTLWLRQGDTYRPCASVGRPIDLLEGMPFSGGSGFAAWIAKAGRPVLVPSASRGFRHETLRSFLGVPVRAGGDPQGVITLGHTSRVFEAEERDRLEAIAALLSPAIRHGRIVGRLNALTPVDPFTELFNRQYFLQRLDAEIANARSAGDQVWMLLVSFTTPTGALPGGHWLARALAAFRIAVRSTDVVARWDARTLAVMLLGNGIAAVAQVRDRLAQELRDTTTGCAKEVAFTIRAAAFPADGQTGEELVDTCCRSAASVEGASP